MAVRAQRLRRCPLWGGGNTSMATRTPSAQPGLSRSPHGAGSGEQGSTVPGTAAPGGGAPGPGDGGAGRACWRVWEQLGAFAGLGDKLSRQATVLGYSLLNTMGNREPTLIEIRE